MTEETKEPSVMSMIEQAKQAKAELDKSLSELRAERARNEEILARQIMGGETSAGTIEEKPKELTPKEYASFISRGKLPQ